MLYMCICIYRCAELYRSGKHPQQLQKQRENEQHDIELQLKEKEIKFKKDHISIQYNIHSNVVFIEGDQEHVLKAMRYMGEHGTDDELNNDHA